MARKKKDAPTVTEPPVAETVVEQRAPDQDGAVEVAFVEGTLPEVDRRAEAPVADVAETPAEVPAPVAEARAHHNVSALLESLPVGSRVEFTRGDATIGDRWVVYRGVGVAEHGEGKTLARAVRVIGSKYEHALDDNGRQTARMIHVDERGAVIAPE